MTLEDIKQCRSTLNELNKLCEIYFDDHKDGDWQSYIRWDFFDDERIIISYSYEDFFSCADAFTDYGDMVVNLTDLCDM